MNVTRLRQTTVLIAVALLLPAICGGVRAQELPPPATQPVDFVRDVGPIFERACYGCHGPSKQRSNFRLDVRDIALKGGDIGTAILPGKSAESPLIRYVAGLEDGLLMPPEGKRLDAVQIGVLRRWIDDGAKWPDSAAGNELLPKGDWWSFRTVVAPAVPQITDQDRAWVRTPIDAFIVARLRQEGLSPSPEADRRTLIRRLTFDLHGLPPTVDEVQEFVADSAPDAYERLVDRLLSSERYGERWARHWLDIAHYADSHGQDQDRPRPNAWPYRDYLIRSLNSDKPYSRFVTEQVAGDVNYPEDPAAITATGFLAAGPWDESSLRDIREDSIDRLIGQYLDRDDILVTTMACFNGLTVGCARCHDHKFDPISQEDYYNLQAVFAGIDKAERVFDLDPVIGRQRTQLNKQLGELRGRKGKVEPSLLTPEQQTQVAAFESKRAASTNRWVILEPTSWKAKEGSILKALLDRSILAVGNRPERDTYTATFETNLAGMTGFKLEVMTDETLPHQGPGRQDNGNLHLSEIRVTAAPRGEPDKRETVVLKHATADFDQVDWDISRALDGKPETAWGIFPAVGKPHEAVVEFDKPVGFPAGTVLTIELDQLHGRGHLIGRFRISATNTSPFSREIAPLPAEVAELLATPAESRSELQRSELARWLNEKRLEQELAALPAPLRVYCGTNQFTADGSFRPTATPRPIHVLARGDINRPGKVAAPGALPMITELPAKFEIADPSREGERRAALANWLSNSANPLTWRVIVNRVWHYHFGKGIVDTPSDFGRMGGKPSHPQLLDWLAADFRNRGGSLKELHRLIVTSSTYRQVSRHDPTAAAKDGDNRLLWRMNRGRLDAESVRDAVLLISDRLDNAMYGPPVMHFVMKPGVHVTPVADYDAFDVDSPQVRRRSVYRYVFRTRPDPLLDVLDCPDASQAAPVRSASVSALQALALWNNKFTLRYAEHLAEVASQNSADPQQQVQWVTQRVLCRPTTAQEQIDWSDYVRRRGLANLCRVLLNSNEFLFVD